MVSIIEIILASSSQLQQGKQGKSRQRLDVFNCAKFTQSEGVCTLRTTKGTIATLSAMALTASALTAFVGGTTPANAAENNCSVSVDNPHYSNGANGVIAKVRVNCTGLRTEYWVNGSLSRVPKVGPGLKVKGLSRDGGETLVPRIFYIPDRGENGDACSSSTYYQASGVITLENGKKHSGTSNRVKVNCP